MEGRFTPEQLEQKKSRGISDGELLKGGAEYVQDDDDRDEILQTTAEQFGEAKNEMNESLIADLQTEVARLKAENAALQDARQTIEGINPSENGEKLLDVTNSMMHDLLKIVDPERADRRDQGFSPDIESQKPIGWQNLLEQIAQSITKEGTAPAPLQPNFGPSRAGSGEMRIVDEGSADNNNQVES